ncbi:MAG: transcriptional repressor NrdR [Puniceicoccaceae bacterium]|nr:MAG: transcriptional repressor NrdR [Puniceicoccaceae bacterium]
MRCPKCTSTDDKVIDSRISREGTTIRRRRECLGCGHRFSTSESILREGLMVIKRDGRREEFDRAKIIGGLRKACEKRPIDLEQLNMLVEEVIDTLESEYDYEIPSAAIGEHLMQRLKRIDPIAYLRFASVYRDFRDLSEFMNEISRLDA